MKILLIEDDKIVSDLIMTALLEEAYEVIVATDGLQGMCKFYNVPDIDLVITDYRMPEFNGDEVSKYVRRTKNNVPVIMITGYSSEFSRMDAYKIGIDVYIEKPVDLGELKRTIKILSPFTCCTHRENDTV